MDAAASSRRRWPPSVGPTIVCAQAGEVNTGSYDRRRDRRRSSRDGRVAARRRGVRAVGGGEPELAHLARRRRRRRLVGDRRAQVAERPVRLRARVLSRTRTRIARRWRSRAAYLVGQARRRPRRSSTGRPSRRAARAASPCTRRFVRSAVAASPTSSTAAATLGAPLRSEARRRSRLRGAERGRAEPGALPVRGRRRRRRGARRRPASGEAWMGGTDVGRPGGDPPLGLELADDEGGHRPHGRGVRGGARNRLTGASRKRYERPRGLLRPGTVKATIVRRSLHSRGAARRPGLPSRHGARPRSSLPTVTSTSSRAASRGRATSSKTPTTAISSSSSRPRRPLRPRRGVAVVVQRIWARGELIGGEPTPRSAG